MPGTSEPVALWGRDVTLPPMFDLVDPQERAALRELRTAVQAALAELYVATTAKERAAAVVKLRQAQESLRALSASLESRLVSQSKPPLSPSMVKPRTKNR
jgi:hypothetical protein